MRKLRPREVCLRSCNLVGGAAESLPPAPPHRASTSALPSALRGSFRWMDRMHQWAPGSLAPGGVWARGSLPGVPRPLLGTDHSLCCCAGGYSCGDPLQVPANAPHCPQPQGPVLFIVLHSAHTSVGRHHLFPAGPWTDNASSPQGGVLS